MNDFKGTRLECHTDLVAEGADLVLVDEHLQLLQAGRRGGRRCCRRLHRQKVEDRIVETGQHKKRVVDITLSPTSRKRQAFQVPTGVHGCMHNTRMRIVHRQTHRGVKERGTAKNLRVAGQLQGRRRAQGPTHHQKRPPAAYAGDKQALSNGSVSVKPASA